MMKTLFKIFLSLGILFILLVGVWLGVNLWPREMEAPLWTEADLGISADSQKGSWPLVIAMQEDAKLEALYEDLYEELPDFFNSMDGEPPLKGDEFWQEMKKIQPELSAFLQKSQYAVQAYEKLLNASPFIDQSPEDEPPWLFLLELHKIGTAYVVEKILQGDQETAYAFWLKMFQFDQEWSKTARSLLSSAVAISILQDDLDLFVLMREFPPSKHQQLKVYHAIKDFDPEKIDLRRVVIAEYLYTQKAVDEFSRKLGQENLWFRINFNRALVRQEINGLYRELDHWAQDPKRFNDKVPALLDQKVDNIRKGTFWWFMNPGGKVLIALVWPVSFEMFQKLESQKQDLIKLRFQLLNQSLFPAELERQEEK